MIGKGSVQSDRIQFYAPYSVSRLRSQWTDIHAIMDGNNAKSWEWCALHHALSIQQKINNVDFYTFMKWIKKEFNEEYITSANYKNYKYDYFVMNNQEEYNLKKYREYYLSRQNPKQRGKTFGVKQINAFNRVFDNIYIPLLKVIAK